MLVAALIPPSLLLRLISAVERMQELQGRELVLATGWHHLTELLRMRPVSVAVVDPSIHSVLEASELLRLIRMFPSTPMVAYTTLAPTAVQAMPILMRRGLYEMVLHPHDDQRRLARILAAATTPTIVVRLRTSLQDQIARLPTKISAVLHNVLRHPQLYESVSSVVTESGYQRSAFHNLLSQVGLSSPKRLCVAARVAHAAMYLRDSGASVGDVAAKLGYPYVHHLIRHMMQSLEVQPGQLRKSWYADALTDEEIVTRLVSWIGAR